MSFSAQQAGSFIDPLWGRTTTFIMDGRLTNLAFARSILTNLELIQRPCVILDIDALYSSNSDYVFERLSEEQSQTTEVLVPEPESDLEVCIASVLGSRSDKILVVDSLNSLYHLLSSGRRSSKSRKLSFFMACLSYLARTEKRIVLLTMYQRERAMRFGRGTPISDLSDLTVSVSLKDGTLTLKCERGVAWSGGVFFLPIP